MFDPDPRLSAAENKPIDSAPGLAAWAEWETFLRGRDREIADHLGVPVRAIAHARETNMAYWEWYEYRTNTDAFEKACRRCADERRQVRELTREQVRELTREQVRELTREQVRELTREQVRELTREQVRELTREQVRELTREQVRELTREQVRELTREADRTSRPRHLSGWDRAMAAAMAAIALYFLVGQAAPGFWASLLNGLLNGLLKGQ